MHFIKKKTSLFIYILFIFFIILGIIIHNNCNFNKLINVIIDYNYNYAYYSCKKLSNYNLKNYIKNKVSNTHFEKIIRSANKNQIKKSYTFLKKNNEIIANNSNKNIIPQKILGIKNDINPFLKEKNLINQDEKITWKRSHGGYKNLKYNKSSNPINLENIKDLSLEWSYSSIDDKINQKLDNVEANPIFHDGKVFSVTADRKLISLNATYALLLYVGISCLLVTRLTRPIS